MTAFFMSILSKLAAHLFEVLASCFVHNIKCFPRVNANNGKEIDFDPIVLCSLDLK